ncbi:MAG: hypothetical protein P8181_06475 [bacterium]
MSRGGLGRGGIAVVTIASAAVIALLEIAVNRTPDGTFLVAITFWTQIVQGCIALAATGELAKGVWLIPIRRELLSVYPLLLVGAALFLLVGLKMDIYPWTHEPTGWLDVRFFLIRNVVILLLTFAAARRLTFSVMRHRADKNRWAVFYITLFVVSQSLVAFDWIMTLEHPWVSTLFGGYFFVESFLMGLCVAAFILLVRMRAPQHGLTEPLRDTAKMIFAFCFMWAGFFFAQFLVIWYGNIPEEVGYLLERVTEEPFEALSWSVLVTVWVIPFIVLLNGRIKTVPAAVSAIALIILGGLFVEKLVMVMPVTPIHVRLLALETLLLVMLVPVFVASTQRILPQEVTEEAEPLKTP